MIKHPQPTARVKSVKRVYDGYFKLDEYIIEAEKHGGGTVELHRVIFERGHSVAVLAYDPATDNVLLVNQISAGAIAANDNPFDSSLPAGSIWRQ